MHASGRWRARWPAAPGDSRRRVARFLEAHWAECRVMKPVIACIPSC